MCWVTFCRCARFAALRQKLISVSAYVWESGKYNTTVLFFGQSCNSGRFFSLLIELSKSFHNPSSFAVRAQFNQDPVSNHYFNVKKPHFS